jgi:hypothetical protein
MREWRTGALLVAKLDDFRNRLIREAGSYRPRRHI